MTNVMYEFTLQTDDLLSSAHGNREDVPDVCLFMTHAKSSVDKRDTLSQAWSARNRGVHIVVVGLGTDADMMEIDGIASDPKSLNAFHAPSWRDLPSRFDDVLKATCDSKYGMLRVRRVHNTKVLTIKIILTVS